MNQEPYTPTSDYTSSRTMSFSGGLNDTMKPLQVSPSTVPSIVSDIQTTIGTQGM